MLGVIAQAYLQELNEPLAIGRTFFFFVRQFVAIAPNAEDSEGSESGGSPEPNGAGEN